MDGTDLREYQASPGTDAEASISSDGVSGKGGKMPSQGGEIMDIEYFSDHAEGKKKRRRGRLIIFVDESEERTRWVPWALLAALILGAIVAAVVIIRFAVNSDDGTQSSAAKRVDLNGGKYTNYQDCAGMMARLRLTSLKHEFPARTSLSAHQTRWDKGVPNDETIEEISTAAGQHDVLVPLLDDIINLGDAPQTTAISDGYIYTSSGTQLKVLSTGGSITTTGTSIKTASVVSTLDFAMFAAFNHTNTDIEVIKVSGQGSLKIPYGLSATFQVEQLFLPSQVQGVSAVLAVVGSATNAAPTFPGPSPKLIFTSRGSTEYVSEVLRPFNSTVVALVDVSDPADPKVVSISEFEGEFVSIAQEQSRYWVFVKSSAHVPENHESSDDSKLTMDIMPLFRNLPLDSKEAPQWQHMGKCIDVSRLELGAPRVGNNYLLAAIAMPVKVAPHGEVLPDDISLFVQGWATRMVPVLTAHGPDRLNLYLSEAIRYTPQASSSASEADLSVITAVSHFRLSGSNMSYSNYTINIGQTPFQGALQFLQEPPRLSLLTSQYGDSAGGALRSSLTVYTPTLSQESQSVGQLRERQPTGVIYPTGSHAFISFTVQSRPWVQVLPTQSIADIEADNSKEQDNRGAGPLDQPQQGVQRLAVSESVDLMKALVVDNNDTSLAYILLLAGTAVPEVEVGNGATGGHSTQPAASQVPDGKVQFSLYSYSPGASSNIMLLKTVSITTTSLASEAFLDARAALLFHVPKDLEGRAYFAMPVMITNVPDLTAVNCTDTGGFSGVLIWRLSFSYTSRDGFSDSVAVQRLAAVPAWGRCGFGESSSRYQDVAVKRIRMFGSDGDLHLTAMSRCSVATVRWENITSLTPTPEDAHWRKFVPQTEILFAEGCPELAMSVF